MSTKLQTLATFWQNFGLANVQKGLDEVATDITVQQDESDTSRKALIELLRDFKKTNSDEVKQAVSPVVKTFQNEIDALAKRAKVIIKLIIIIGYSIILLNNSKWRQSMSTLIMILILKFLILISQNI